MNVRPARCGTSFASQRVDGDPSGGGHFSGEELKRA